ncbi:MAG: tRNA (adenosine(37)-N6)-threonylcarbamoyltransferase complex dimerization subunit type 1 TsaB [Paracoccaceae bacterium]
MTAPLVLAFDTSAAHCAAALLRGDAVLAERTETMDKGQAERLVPLLETVLSDAGLGWRDLSALAVGTGPGNFTGVRIAIATARGLALALNIPAIGVTRFDALLCDLPEPVWVIEDARRGEVYLQAPARSARLAPLSEALAIPQGAAIIGSATHMIPGALPVSPRHPLAVAIAHVGLTRLGTAQPRPAPFYLRGADAAPPADPPPVILP